MLEGDTVATVADLLRLLAVPVLLYAAWSDVRTRRITNRLWPPLLLVGVVALVFEGWVAFGDGGIVWREFALATGLSLGLLIPLAYGFWYLGGFGGADAKAIMVLAVVFPTIPSYEIVSTAMPAIEPSAGVFSLAILTNAVLIGLLYPIALAARNLLAGDIASTMFIGRRIPTTETVDVPGRLLETPTGVDRRGLDLDALRMYLRWRDITLAELRSDPDRFRSTAPPEPQPPGDGAITDGGTLDDPWAAGAFLEDAPGSAYGTTPSSLRAGLEVLVERDRVWYTPGIPFVLLIAIGLLLALSVGDLLGAILLAVGLA